MSVAEFVMSLAVNGICLIVVIFFYWRLIGKLTSDKPANAQPSYQRRRPQPYVKPTSRGPPTPQQTVYYQRTPSQRCPPPPDKLPPWREEWPSIPDPPLQKKLRRRDRERRSSSNPRVTSVRLNNKEGRSVQSLKIAFYHFYLFILPVGRVVQW
ncbi:unnamed protein product [Nippostrongylus brasiliensis]|uniref:Secreted protein n=1 Tax=Nippostrongylus brasiliensis TaxID=27835 RepID=A0A0N4XL68_NIPBR|nr:unnamed protein product [Nippostrongylus brasiliensis]